MRAVGVGIANALHHRQRALGKALAERSEGSVKAEALVQPQDLAFREGDGGPELGVERIGVGDDGVKAIIPARELDHDQ